MNDDDAEVVRRCLSGDESAMRALVERYQGIVFGLCYRMLGRREDAEDASQEAFVRALRSLSQWDASRPFRPWLLAIASNRCRTALEKSGRQPVASEIIEQATDRSLFDNDGLGEELALALDRLRPEYRECFVLFHEQELSCLEISQVMDRPVGTIKIWLHRSRKELAEHLTRRGVAPYDTHDLHRI